MDGGKRSDVVSQASLDRMMREVNTRPSSFVSAGMEDGEGPSLPAVRWEVEKVDVERNQALEGQRAGEAVFKAIFGSDDEEDE